jgi:hypothetical protein
MKMHGAVRNNPHVARSAGKQARQNGTRAGLEFQPKHVLGPAAEFGKLLPWHHELIRCLLSSLVLAFPS